MSRVVEIFWRFLLLGCSSFGGPVAHLGYFRSYFVERLGWLSDAEYARIVALSQFLPGPGSSQVGFAIGLGRAGVAGGMAAFVGFTLPSFVLMYALALMQPSHAAGGFLGGVVAGLGLFAVVVVADAVAGMYRSFCRTPLDTALAIGAAAALLLIASLWMQLGLFVIAALIGAWRGRQPHHNADAPPAPRRTGRQMIGWGWLLLFALLFGLLPLGASLLPIFEMAAGFYHTGSLVFGGGHVVLPLLQQMVGEAVTPEQFLVGYAAAQAVPGPMFSFAAFLGATLLEESPLLGALVATVAIFAPGFLLLLGLKDTWEALTSKPMLMGAAGGINAAVVGLLLAALYQPVFVHAVTSSAQMAAVLLGWVGLRIIHIPIGILLLLFGATGGLLALT